MQKIRASHSLLSQLVYKVLYVCIYLQSSKGNWNWNKDEEEKSGDIETSTTSREVSGISNVDPSDEEVSNKAIKMLKRIRCT